MSTICPIIWQAQQLQLLDQRLLPDQVKFLTLTSAPQTAEAIRNMVVRGAPAIGITAAYGLVLSLLEHRGKEGAWRAAVDADRQTLAKSRPTAVNLFWALDRMQRLLLTFPDASLSNTMIDKALAEAHAIAQEDVAANRAMGTFGAALLADGVNVLTHCNAGALATAGHGTALGVIRSAKEMGKLGAVFADETRPWLQGSRLTAWELLEDGIPVTLIVEGAAGHLMALKKIDWVIVGADRITANGDVANKIGTYGLAVLARFHGVKFMVAAPTSTIDMDLPDGSHIPIEERGLDEVLGFRGLKVAAQGAGAWNPAFDVTPAALIDAIVTERGVVEQPNIEKMRQLME